ncbi:MAG: tetratricopeptide repeat protein [Synergistetes bacterium]|nr:tetratricopeptide repeat protein [Synergistota bacterium]MCX8128268.1 tetratricopeptide repeat protein [Synergistota bacterium]MDW8192715.1 tetratricopeptide repeat protein [Synergistota bacterium]
MKEFLFLKKGRSEKEKGNYEEAIKLLKKAIKEDPSYIEAHLELGRTYTIIRDLYKAELQFRQVLLMDKKNLAAKHNLGLVYYLQGKSNNALKEWMEVLHENPDYVPTLLILADYHLERNEPNQAKQYYERVLKADPYNWEAKINLGKIFYEEGREKEALHLWEETKEENSHDITVIYRLAEIYINIFKSKEAISLLLHLIKNENDIEKRDEVKNLLLNLLEYVKEDLLVINTLKELYLIFPEDKDVLISTIKHLINKGNLKEASLIMNKLLQENPDNPRLRYLNGLLYYKKGQNKEAIEIWETLLKEQGETPLLLERLGEVYIEQKDYEKALYYFQRLREYKIHNKEVTFTLASLYQQTGNLDKAIELWEEAIDLDPNDKNAYANLAICYIYQGDVETAFDITQYALLIPKENAFLYFTAGLISLLQGNMSKTLSYWKKCWTTHPLVLGTYWNLAVNVTPITFFEELNKTLLKSRYKKEFKDTLARYIGFTISSNLNDDSNTK